jgi:hypothetical protein
MLIPLGLFLSIVFGIVLVKIFKDLFNRKPISLQFNWKPLWSIFGFINVALFTFMISNVLDPFNCTRQADGSYIMTHNPTTRCFGAAWNAQLPLVIFFFVVNGICGPLFVVHNFWKNRNSPEDELFHSRFLPLMLPYKRQYFFWELVIMIKRSAFVLSSNFLTSGGASYVTKFFSSILILYFFFWIEILCSPFTTQEFNLNSIV